MTVWVKTENETITDSAPVVKRFIGQPLRNLARWMSRQGGLQIDLLGDTECSALET